MKGIGGGMGQTNISMGYIYIYIYCAKIIFQQMTSVHHFIDILNFLWEYEIFVCIFITDFFMSFIWNKTHICICVYILSIICIKYKHIYIDVYWCLYTTAACLLS